MTSATRLAGAHPDEVWADLDRGHRPRKQRTTTMLQAAARHGVERWGGDLRLLREAAGGEVARATVLVEEFTGIGAVGAEIFLREGQVPWEELRPFAGDRALAAAAERGLPADAAALSELGPADDFPPAGGRAGAVGLR